MKGLREAEFWLLCALAEGDAHGYALSQRVADMSDGQVTLGPGTLYATLERLLGQGLIEEAGSEIVDGRHRRRYRLASAGRRAVLDETDRRRAALQRAHIALGLA